MIEKTLVIVKPDGVMRGLVGEIITRLERKGLKIVAGRFEVIPRDKAANHYAEHEGKPFYNGLLDFITSAPVMIMVVEGNAAISSVRNIVGKTYGVEATPGSIRGDYGSSKAFNLIHASDSQESSDREIANFFEPSEVVSYNLPNESWIVSDDDKNWFQKKDSQPLCLQNLNLLKAN